MSFLSWFRRKPQLKSVPSLTLDEAHYTSPLVNRAPPVDHSLAEFKLVPLPSVSRIQSVKTAKPATLNEAFEREKSRVAKRETDERREDWSTPMATIVAVESMWDSVKSSSEASSSSDLVSSADTPSSDFSGGGGDFGGGGSSSDF